MIKRMLLIVLLSIPLIAQESLTLQEAWEFALRNNLSLRQQQKVIQKSQEELAKRKAEYLPGISAAGLYNHVSDIALFQIQLPPPLSSPEPQPTTVNVYDVNLSLSQPLFTGFRTKNLVKSAREEQKAQEIEERVLQNQILFQVGALYYQIQSNLIQQDVLIESIERVDAQLTAARNFYFAEQIPAFDTLEVANRKLRLQNQLQNLRNLHQILLTNFKFALNTDSLLRISRPAVLKTELIIPPLTEYYTKAMHHRPELEKVTALQQAQLFRARALKSAYYPQLSATASYHYFRLNADFAYDKWQDFYTIGLYLQWNIWNWKRDKRAVEQAQLDYKRLDIASEQVLHDIKQQVTEAYQYLDNSRQQIRLQKNLVAQEEERYRITREQFEQGQATNLDLSNAERALTEAKLLLQQTYLQWFQYQLQVEFATGMIGKQEL
jgi:outer membrane protein TolC